MQFILLASLVAIATATSYGVPEVKTYSYAAPAVTTSFESYKVAPTTYEAPKVAYEAPKVAYEAPKVAYEAPKVAYEAPKVAYEAPKVAYEAPKVAYEAPKVAYEAPKVAYEAPKIVQEIPKTHWEYTAPVAPKVTYEAPKMVAPVSYEAPKMAAYEAPKMVAPVSYEAPKMAAYEAPKMVAPVSYEAPKMAAYEAPKMVAPVAYEATKVAIDTYAAPVSKHVETYSVPAYAPVDVKVNVAEVLSTVAPVAFRAASHDDGYGNYGYRFESADGIKKEEEGVMKPLGEEMSLVKKGSVSWISPEGLTYSLTYVADETGFHPVGDHLPTPPPTPEAILEGLAKIRAAEELKMKTAAAEETKSGYEHSYHAEAKSEVKSYAGY